MKKLLVAAVVAVMSLSLAACDLVPDEVVDQVQFCIDNPDDPSCEVEVDCTLNPDDPSCPQEVDCTVNPDDPACEQEVDCTVNPDDPSCPQEVDCTVNPDDPACEQEVDCTVNPDDPSCPLVCDTGYELNQAGDTCVLIDTRTPAEIAAALIIANWDGTMDHVNVMMSTLNFDNGMTMETTYNVQVTEDGTTHNVNMLQRDSIAGNVIKREIVQSFDDEVVEFTLIIETTDTGFIVYYDTSFLRAMLTDVDPDGNVQAVLDTLDANGTWFMFKFDDSLANLVELEVLQEMVTIAFYNEFGEDVWEDVADGLGYVEDELEYYLEIEFADYGLNLHDFFLLLVDEDFYNAEMMLVDADWDDLFFDLDQIHVVPEIVWHMTDYEATYLMYDPNFDLAAEVLYLETYGTVDWLNQLTEEEVETLLEVHFGDDFMDLYYAVEDGEFEEYILGMLINDPDVQYALSMLPDFDEAAFTTTIENLDWDQLVNEFMSLPGLLQSVYEGQTSFDMFVTGLQITAPAHAEILTHFSGVVNAIQPYMVVVDDINYGLSNLVIFSEYFTPDYYLDIELIGLMISADDDANIVTTVALDGSETSQIFEDLAADIYTYLDGFETFDIGYVEHLNCPDGETCMPFVEYLDIIDGLEMLGEITISTTYAPLSNDRMEIVVDFTDLLQSINGMDDMSMTTIDDVSITVRYIEGADVMVPTDVTDLNAVAEELAQLGLVVEAYEYLGRIADYYVAWPMDLAPHGTEGMKYLDYFGDQFGISTAFDLELSYVEYDFDPLNPSEVDYAIQLFWLDGTPVFDEAIGYDEVMDLLDLGDVPTRAEFETLIGLVNEDSFNMTKLFLVYLWENEYYGQVPF